MTEGERLRNEGMEQVLSNEHERFKKEFCKRSLEQKEDFLFENIRLQLEREGLFPRHHNSCGALASGLIKKGLVVDTGKRMKSEDPRSHARKQPVYRVVR